ncbi:hypothetical protein AURDEDRAFT_111427 [Auricularia subglabra TFB-10046 SS5]|nr:hypothetical protein AURDEDRAFT_111427 [Auricularia subglabra TFB-10046 SS5]
MFSFDKLRSKAKARRSQRPATPPSPGSFFTSPRSPRWATRTNSDGSQYAIPPVPSLPPPLPDVMPIMAPPMPAQTPPAAPGPRPSTSSSSVDQQDNLRLDLGFNPAASSSSLTDWFPGGMGPVSTSPPKPQGHRHTPSMGQRSMQASDALSPNSLFSPSSTVISSPNTTVAGSYPNGSVLGKEPRGFSALALNSSDPILPYYGSEPKKDSPSRRVGPVPAPIRIPDGNFHHPAVQVDRSQSPAPVPPAASSVPERPVAGPPPSPPPSPGTAHDAILASAFVLSGERTAESSWTLGATGLARMDSTTLPRDSYLPGQSMSKLRGPRPIRTNSRRQSSAPGNLRRSSSATAVLPGTPPPTMTVPPTPPPASSSTPPGSGAMPTVVVSGPDMKRKRISAITEISSAGSVYSFPDEDAAVLRPDTTSASKETLPSLTTGTSSASDSLASETEDEQERTLRPDERPALEQMWEFLLPDGSRMGTPRSGSTSTPSPFPESRMSPQSAPGSSTRSTAPTSASPGPSPRAKSQKPSMLKLQDVPKRASTKRKSVEVVQDSTPDSPDFQETLLPKGKGKQPAPSVPHTAALLDDILSPAPNKVGHQRPPSGSTVNTVTGGASSSNGHSSTGSSGGGVLYLSFKKDGAASVSGNMSSAMFPETPRSFEHNFSPAMGQTFTVEVTPANPKARTRAPTLPIGPRTGLSHIRTDGSGLSSLSRDSSRGGSSRQRATSSRTPLPPSPKFTSAPVRWKGLTYDAARWTLSSEQLQEIVTRAIKQSAESSSIRLLQPEVLDGEVPAEVDALTKQREELRVRLKAQIRTRRLLMRKLTAGNSPDAVTPQGMARTMSEIMDACALCDQLSEELFHVSDQLAQITKLRDVHQASALSMALRKINTSFVRVTSEAVELQKHISTLEAEREEAWHTAESVERELNDVRAKLTHQTASCTCSVGADDSGHVSDAEGSRPASRVAAARKTSMRASKASLRLSARKSRASSISSRYTIFSPDAADDVPPVPPMPVTSPLAALTDFSQSLTRERQSLGAASFMSSAISPTPEARALASAQAELLELLGINLSDITGNRSSGGSSNGPRRRPRSASFAAPPHPSPGLLDAAVSMSPQPSPRWTVGTGSPIVDNFGRRLRRSMSDYSKRVTAPRPDSMLLSPPRDGSFQAHHSRVLLEDPDAILAMMTRANSSNEASPMPGRTFPRAGRTYI